MNSVSLDRLNELFEYNHSTGEFVYKNNTIGHYIGDKAGCTLNNGYRQLWVDGKKYLAHRIAFYMYHGYLPKYLDHINGDRADNRIENLRESTLRKNQQNRIEHRNGDRLVGAHYNKAMRTKPWRSIIRVNGKNIHLGYYKTEQEAHIAYMKACEGL